MSSRFHLITAWLASLIGLLLLLLLTHAHWFGLLSSHFIGGSQGDGGLYVWLTSSFYHSPSTALHGESFTFYPYPLTRAWSDSFFLPSALASALISSGSSLPLAYNVVYIGALLLNGVAVLALCRALALEWFPSFFAAAAFSCCSYLTGNFGHPQLQYFFWIPLSWACVLGSSGSGAARWLTAGLCVTASFYCAVYYSIFAALGLGLILIFSLQLDVQGIRRALIRALALVVGMVPIAWFLPSYLLVKDTFGSRGLYEADAFAASGLSYLSFSNFNRLFGFTSQWTHNEATLCAGIAALSVALLYLVIELRRLRGFTSYVVLVAAAVLVCASSIIDRGMTSEILVAISAWVVLLSIGIFAVRRRSARALCAALVGIFFILSFGPAGNPTKGEPALAPFTALYSVMPGMDSVRAVSRFGSVVIMGVYIAAACALSTFFKGKRLALSCSSMLLLGITLLENYTPIFPLDPLPPPPAAFGALQHTARQNEAAIALPLAGELERGRIKSWSESAVLNTQYALWSAPLNIPFVNGYSGQRPKLNTELPAVLRAFPSLDSFDWLSRICGLRWIIVVPSLFASWDQQLFEQRLQEQRGRFSLQQILPDGSMLIRIEPWTSTSAPIFAPAKSRLLLEFEAPSSATCVVTTHDLVRDGKNDVTSVQTAQKPLEYGFSRLEAPAKHTHTGQPHLFTVDTRPCSAPFRCTPLDLGGLK